MNEGLEERRFHDVHCFKVMINIYSHRDVVQHVRAKLNCAKKELFRQMCFSQSLDLKVHQYNAILIHCVLF